MVHEDRDKLGPMAVAWWNNFFALYEEEVKKICDECLACVKRIQDVHPHGDSPRHVEDNKAKMAAVYHFL